MILDTFSFNLIISGIASFILEVIEISHPAYLICPPCTPDQFIFSVSRPLKKSRRLYMVLPDTMAKTIFGLFANPDIILITFSEGIASSGLSLKPTRVPS